MAGRPSLARGTVLGITAQAWQMATAFVLYHFLSGKLGVAGFGRWTVVLSVLGYFEIVLTTGLVKVATKRLAAAPEEAPRIERAAYLGQAVVATVLFVIAMVAAGPIAAAMRTPSLEFLIRVAALDIPLVAAFMMASANLLGHQRFARQAFGMTVYATAKFLLIGILVWSGFSVAGALVGNALASLVGFAATFTLWKPASIKLGETIAETRGLGLAAIPFVTQTLIGGVLSESSIWFVQAVMGSVAAGLFGAAYALATVPLFLFAGLSRALFPSVARAAAEKDDGLVSLYATNALRLALLVTVLGVGVIAATGRELLTFVYTAKFAPAAVPFTILMVVACGQNVRAVCTDVLMARDRRRAVLIIISASAVTQVALLSYVVSRFGMLGAAYSMAIVTVTGGVASVYVMRDIVGARVALALLRSIVAATIVSVGLAAVRPAGWWLLVAYAVAVAVYVVLLLMVREIDREDINSLRVAAGGKA